MRWTGVIAGLGLATAMTVPALAHHSIAAMYDRDKSVELQGVLSKIELQNPHSMLEITVPGTGGKTVVWTIESRGVQGMTRSGFDRAAVQIGDKLTIKGSPARAGGNQMWMTDLKTGAGKSYDFSIRGGGGFTP